jgi:hypothetical protein
MTKPVTMITKNESHQLIESPIKVMARIAQLRNRRLGMTPIVAAGCQVWLSAPPQEASVGRVDIMAADTGSNPPSIPGDAASDRVDHHRSVAERPDHLRPGPETCEVPVPERATVSDAMGP